MTIQQYLIIENNVVTNNVVWDGDVQTWTPPVDSIQLITDTTPALVWELDSSVSPSIYVLQEKIGAGTLGFTWDGTVLTTNEPKPTPKNPSENQPTTTGTTTI